MPLMNRIQDKTAIIGVMGLGYVGLPLAIAFAEAGFEVEGFDTNFTKVNRLRKGYTTIEDIDHLKFTTLMASSGKPNFTSKLPDSWNVDIAIICVPTPITDDKKPDLSYIKATVELLKTHIQQDRNSMVVLESSTYPGTTREIVQKELGDKVKYIAYSPERIDPGNKEYDIRNTPKLVGGIDKESTELAVALYSHIVDLSPGRIVPVSSPETAETAKLFENVFRNVNIALVNELAMICEKVGVSVWEVIDAAATKPFGFMPFYPGVGVGGHCIPVDPYYLVDKAKEFKATTRLVDTALNINEVMPILVARQVGNILVHQVGSPLRAKVLMLGVAFKKDVGDTRESPAIDLLEILQSWGVDAYYNDPFVPRISNYKTLTEESVELTDELLETADCVMIATDHSCYDWKRIVDKAKLVFDTRNATRGIVSEKIRRLGEKGASE